MRKKFFLFLFALCFITIDSVDCAERSLSSNNITRHQNSVARATTSTRSKNLLGKNITSRTTNTNQSIGRSATNQHSNRQLISSRHNNQSTSTKTKQVIGRSATSSNTSSNIIEQNFNNEYNTCRTAYFTCMDQFCANMDDTYRRCICSSRLTEIKQKQSSLDTATDSLTAFHDLNMDVITKTPAEVQAMTSATIGEQTANTTSDTSASSQQLSAISSVLSKTKNKSLSNAGTLDAGGDIKSIWSTTDLVSGADIANLSGESLYNSVNAQCSNMVTEQCPSSILNMVISAYGMYIENDCTTLATELSKKKNSANATIRETNREMNTARLENYDNHNSLSINDCISSVRNDLTADTACGTDFVHCLDVTGLYLNIDTGEPIYSTNFYDLANQTSLDGNILNNQTNHMFVSTLNDKKAFAQNSLDKCSDSSDNIWDEFMRQAIIEIHQKQQEKIKTVKTECLSIVNQCYDEQTESLKDFNTTDDKTLLGMTMETVEDLCQDKLTACSNLYGGGPSGLTELVNTMHDIVNQKILAECQNLLTEFATNLCTVQSSDTLHSYPYACRVYAPGAQKYATIASCNSATTATSECSSDYIDSLYQRFVNYAMQVCIRPSEYETLQNNVPTLVLQDINIVMNKVRVAMGTELSAECERLGGIWVSTPYTDTSIELQEKFYTETGTNKQWGYCKAPDSDS